MHIYFYCAVSLLVVCSCGQAVNRKYLLYDCNPGEGFNLRRDVFLRIANLVKAMKSDERCKNDEWVLVLPPWGRIGYHWKERDMEQSKIKWSHFFDVESINLYIPVIEFEDYVEEVGEPVVEEIWYLQSYAEGWTPGKWEEKMHERPCIDPPAYQSDASGLFRGWFFGYPETYAKKFKCVSVQANAKFLVGPLCGGNTTATSVMLDRGESVLHDMFGGVDYWRCRRSMIFSKQLRDEADKFRADVLDSTDEKDQTVMPKDWRDHTCKDKKPPGGPYIAAHLRRKDFLHARKDSVPSIPKVAEKLTKLMKEYDVQKVFIASDGTKEDMKKLKSLLPQMVMYEPTNEQKKKYKMGGLAIIDQIICSHARYFIGTKESTFSFRIQDEREIMCFNKDTTFNRFCGDEEKDCEQPSRWKIVWNSDNEIWQNN